MLAGVCPQPEKSVALQVRALMTEIAFPAISATYKVPVATSRASPCGLAPAGSDTECTRWRQPRTSPAWQVAVLITETELEFWSLTYRVRVAGSAASPSGPSPART